LSLKKVEEEEVEYSMSIIVGIASTRGYP
jgi:hypothetical protein